MTNKFVLLSDGSCDPKSKIGFGAYLLLSEFDIPLVSHLSIKNQIILKKFNNTSSTKLEVETLLNALENIQKKYKENTLINNLIIYTDSQCIVGLARRRTALEARNFKKKGTNKLINNARLYQKFYCFSDRLKFEIIKVAGHSGSASDSIHKVFSYVDKEVRKALRDYNCN
ncbi:ribonuclease HI [bacterium]